MNKVVKNLLLYLGLFLIIAVILGAFSVSDQPSQETDLASVINKIEQGQVEKITVKGDQVEVLLKDQTVIKTRKEPSESFTTVLKNFDVNPDLLTGIAIEIKDDGGSGFWLATVIPFLLPLLVVGALIWFMMKQVQGANTRALMFGQS